MAKKNSVLIQSKLQQMRLEHKDLDDVIDKLTEDPFSDQIQIQRLKKRKLVIKDQISMLENGVLPDIIA